MLLSPDAFPDGWERDDTFEPEFDRAFANYDGTATVMLALDVEPEIETVEDHLRVARSNFDEATDYDLGDAAFIATRYDRRAHTFFLDSNGLGQVVATRESGSDVVPDETRSQEYAEAMYDHWQNL